MSIQDRMFEAYSRFPDRRKLDLIVLSRVDWEDYWVSLNVDVRAVYETLGFYRIGARKKRIVEVLHRYQRPFTKTVKAVTYKGVPVVVKEEYDEMMRGHKSSRIVLKVV